MAPRMTLPRQGIVALAATALAACALSTGGGARFDAAIDLPPADAWDVRDGTEGAESDAFIDVACEPPLVACGGACVDTSSDPGNCGACGALCPVRPNATATCAARECGLRCFAGFEDRNGNREDGCEFVVESEEVCDGADNDHDGLTDETFPCRVGLDTRPCEKCGTQTCDGNCQWGLCAGQGDCSPDETRTCGRCGTQACTDTCGWGECSGEGECPAGNVEEISCGSCSTQVRTCGPGCTWGAYGDCTGGGVCDPGTSQSCGRCGTQPCTPGCTWGACLGETGECAPGATQACGRCGTQTCTDGCTWGLCEREGACAPDEWEECTDGCGRGHRQCGGDCAWGACQGSCSNWRSCCAGACVSLGSDPYNCGVCGNVCPRDKPSCCWWGTIGCYTWCL